jgi:cold shock protein
VRSYPFFLARKTRGFVGCAAPAYQFNQIREHRNMYQGTVKFFSPRGFGFLKRDDGLDEIYSHKTGIPGGVTLFEGDRVAFDTEISSRSGKIQAVNLRLV